MNKKNLPILFLVLSLFVLGKAEDTDHIVSDIFLIDNEMYNRHTPPGKIIIGINVLSDALYKLSSQEGIIKGGLLQRGFNSLDIPAQRLFDRTDSHLYVLEFKKDNSLEKKEIIIEIRLLPIYIVQKQGEAEKKHEFTLSLFIGDRLIYASKKFSLHDISFKLDLPPSEGRYNPFGLIKGTQKPINTVSILDAVAGIYQLAKYLTSKKEKDEEDKAIEKKRQIETVFIKRNVTGDLWEWKALISLKIKDAQDGKKQ